MKVQLGKPLNHKGQAIYEIDLKLEEMTGRDLLEAEAQMNAEGKFLVTDFSKAYQLRVAAIATRLPVEVLEGLPARDFARVVAAVQLFLVGSDLPDLSPEPAAVAATPPAKS